jgi:2,4-dienoyl-CoA reductase-like NADH-dependent reductase (Old Yellow Enzyme family)
MTKTRLFTPLKLRGVETKNRIVISPMCQYSAEDGLANDWHFVHLGRLALGGAGIVMVEATAVTKDGRITHGDMGLWSDAHIAPLARIATFLRANGAVPAIQLAHAGRKGSMQRPWFGNGPLNAGDFLRGDTPWDIVAPSAIPLDEGWLMPSELTVDALAELRDAYRVTAERAIKAGFDILEVHMAHGYLLHSFLSPLSNKRDDKYGGERAGRMRFPLEVADTVRAAWPADRPLFVRISSVDGLDGGWTIDDSVALARELKARGVDVIDCSSGGLTGSATAARIPRGYSFQLPFAARIRNEAGIATMAVGLIIHPQQAEDALADSAADLIAIAREATFDPNWPLHAEMALGAAEGELYASWPKQAGWWLERREPGLRKLDGPPLPFRTRAGP